MGKLLFIDSDDVNGLSEALKGALERRGVIFKGDIYGEFGFPVSDEEEHDIDPYLGVMPHGGHRDEYRPVYGSPILGSCGGKTYGSCGQRVAPSYGDCGGGSFFDTRQSYGGCGGSGNGSASCGSGGCGVGYNYYPRC
jgi:hypothetical protein